MSTVPTTPAAPSARSGSIVAKGLASATTTSGPRPQPKPLLNLDQLNDTDFLTRLEDAEARDSSRRSGACSPLSSRRKAAHHALSVLPLKLASDLQPSAMPAALGQHEPPGAALPSSARRRMTPRSSPLPTPTPRAPRAVRTPTPKPADLIKPAFSGFDAAATPRDPAQSSRDAA